jgi:cytoskeleton protein RodZ
MTDAAADTQDRAKQAESPGRRLRERRESLGWPLDQTAMELRISRATLEALEADDYTALEAPIFVRGHLRNYGRLLGLPTDELLAAYEAAHVPRAPDLKPSTPRGGRMDAGVPRWVVASGWMVVSASLVFGALWWYAGPHREPVDSLLVAESAERDAEPAERMAEVGPVGPDRPDTDFLFSDLSSLLLPGETTAAPGEAEVGEDAENAERMASTELPAPEPEIGIEADKVPLELRLRAESWIEIYDAHGERVYYGLAGGGERLELNGEAPMRVFLGNAPGVDLLVRGNSFPVEDHVRRDNTARFQIRDSR